MKPNATIALDRIDGDTLAPIWFERIEIKHGAGMGVRLLSDEYGTNWLFWDRHRLGLFDPAESLQTRLTVTVDE
ncbi:MAG: hypothetical protein WC455_30165 [Dehalococcoidia bacterium]|jgi:hypothetical protein